MRRKALILLLFVCAVLPVCAQPKSWTGHSIFPSGTEWPDSSIVRTWNDTFVLAKYSLGGDRYLSLCKISKFMGTLSSDVVSPSIMSMLLPDSLGFDIKDFRIVGGSLVFCGVFADTEAAYGIVSPALQDSFPGENRYRNYHQLPHCDV